MGKSVTYNKICYNTSFILFITNISTFQKTNYDAVRNCWHIKTLKLVLYKQLKKQCNIEKGVLLLNIRNITYVTELPILRFKVKQEPTLYLTVIIMLYFVKICQQND